MESPEHQFLSATFLAVLEQFSALDLYRYREADRKRFDFAATLTRDWSRPLAGQTLWGHTEGVDKDLRMLLADSESEIKPYVARNNVKNQAKVAEAIQDFKTTALAGELFKLKTIWVPDGFNADDERDRGTMQEVLRTAVVEDILFNVVFGRLSATDIEVFLSATGVVGLQLALMAYIAEHTMGNIALPSKALGVSAGPVRERLLVLQAAGFVANPDGRAGFSLLNEVTPRGRVFLDLLRRLDAEVRRKDVSPELKYILAKLGVPVEQSPDVFAEEYWGRSFRRLLDVMDAARRHWGVDLQTLEYRKFERAP